ncbi:MAG: hypothetical protein DRI57_33115 [Deltaproteobacteria bacterium]|nr:MAG: hypothetical protein DRI57_33115 [Deltaproteobacteria bacterium]
MVLFYADNNFYIQGTGTMPDILNIIMNQCADDYPSESNTQIINRSVNVIPLPQSCSEIPPPYKPEEFWNIEQRLYRHALQAADGILLEKLVKLHEDRAFVKESVEKARENSPFPLVSKGWENVSILLQGGTSAVIRTPYLRKDWEKTSGKKCKKRGKKGTGQYPVPEALGIRDGVSPATRSEIALYTVQAASYQEAVEMLERRGLPVSTSTLQRIAIATAQADISLRDAALTSAMNIPVQADGPLAGKRVRAGIDGGRVRTRKRKKGPETKKGRNRFKTPWGEPRVLVIDLPDDEGVYDSLSLPLYDVVIDDADATFSLLAGYLRLLGAAHAEASEFIGDGADRIWDRADEMIRQAEIPESAAVQVPDFYHACEHLYGALKLCKGLSGKKREKLYKKLRHVLRHDPQGVSKTIEQLMKLGTTRRGKKMKKAVSYFERHSHRMNYAVPDEMKLPVGSGQVESAVRRLVSLRFKAPGTFWKEKTVGNLMHLRAFFKSGRWEELIIRVLTGKFHMPAFKAGREEEKISVITGLNININIVFSLLSERLQDAA